MPIHPDSDIHAAPEVVHGWYRWSDIFFEWDKALDDRHRDALKASLNSFALVHPEHPLHVKGETGLPVYIGLLDNGEKRLLVSSAQVDYLRQWLFATGLTDELLPMPHTEGLLTKAAFSSVTQEHFTEAGKFKETQKTLDRNNKRVKNVSGLLKARLQVFEQIREAWQSGHGTWLAMDFESWERDHTLVTEFGWASVSHRNNENLREQGHFKIKYKDAVYANGTFVADNRENFQFGDSEDVQRSELKQRLAELITRFKADGPLFMVFHDPRDDMKILHKLEAPIEGETSDFPDDPPTEGIFVVDTAAMFAALEGENAPSSRNLERMCSMLGLKPELMHNAGNDAYWTRAALESMADGEPVDLQRTRRWPQHVPFGPPPPGAPMDLKVPFNPWEEDSDLSDQEGVTGPLPPYDPKTGWMRGSGPDGKIQNNPTEDDGWENVPPVAVAA